MPNWAAAFFELICHVEVLLRNAIYSQAAAWAKSHGGVTPWFDDPYYNIVGKTAQNLVAAKRVAGAGASEDKVVAELSFGFDGSSSPTTTGPPSGQESAEDLQGHPDSGQLALRPEITTALSAKYATHVVLH